MSEVTPPAHAKHPDELRSSALSLLDWHVAARIGVALVLTSSVWLAIGLAL